MTYIYIYIYYMAIHKDNISFFLVEDGEENNDSLEQLNNLMEEFNEDTNYSHDFFQENDIFRELGNFYCEKYNVSQLLKICDYYDLTKCVKLAKYKKKEMVDAIVSFEIDPMNTDIVNKRQKLWHYMEELSNDKYMKKYIIWS